MMNKRVKELINLLEMSYADFAEKVGVQPSSISHIVSGRNKPSVDFIQKIHKAYPDLNIDWLLFGTGQPFEKTSNEADQKTNTELPSLPFEEYVSPDKENEPSTNISTENNQISDSQRLEKVIQKIIVFYSDGTFEELGKN